MMLLRGRRPLPSSRVVEPGVLPKLLRRRENNRKLILITKEPRPSVPGKVQVLWLSTVDNPGSVDPKKLHVVEQVVWEKLREENADVVLDDFEYILTENGPETALKFVGKLRDMAILTNSNFYVVVSEDVDERMRRILRSIVE
jgi:hypothetical protein